jgi:drug/metabolite transporter (DMT)-like permease
VTRNPDALSLGTFGLVVLLGAGNFLAVRMSNLDLPPFWGAGLRFALAAASFVLIALVLRLRWPTGRDLALTVLYGVFGFAAFYALMYWALVQVTAGVATVVMACAMASNASMPAAQYASAQVTVTDR